MVNTNLFQTSRGRLIKSADTTNLAGGAAYQLGPENALAQYAATGCLNATYYASAEMQLDTVLELCKTIPSSFIGKCAVYARKAGHMKDMPAILCAILAARKDSDRTLEQVFFKTIDNGRMLRTFVQIVRSGMTGRKSFGTRIKRLIRQWLEQRPIDKLFRDSVGEKPSLADVVKMVHPKPRDAARANFYRYLIGKPVDKNELPSPVKEFELFKAGETDVIPDVEFRMLTGLEGRDIPWNSIAHTAPWHATRMNLNTFQRHGVFKDPSLVKIVADRLRNPDEIKKARAFPYQLLSAYKAGQDIPFEIRESLQDAMEIAVANIPSFNGRVAVCVDTSGSMSSPVTGYRGSASSAVRCVDVAALFAASVLRQNKNALIIPFDTTVHTANVNPRDSIMTTANSLAGYGGGGTSCGAALQHLLEKGCEADVVIYFSDNESWVSSRHQLFRGTDMADLWVKYKQYKPTAKLVCVNLTPDETTQVHEQPEVLNIGGFSDAVWDVIANFAASKKSWVDTVNEVTLE